MSSKISSETGRPARARLINLSVLLVSLVSAFSVAEYIVRQLPMSDRLGWNLVAPVPERVAEFTRRAIDPEAIRIAAFGDSFTEYRDTQHYNYVRFAAKFSKERSHKIAVVNLAEAGTGPRRYLANFEKYLPVVKPDIAIFGIYFGNDVIYSDQSVVTLSEAAPESEMVARAKRFLKQSIFINIAYRMLKLHIPWLQSGFYERTLNHIKNQNDFDAEFVARRLRNADPEMLRLARGDAINPWDIVFGILKPELFRKLWGVETGKLEKNFPGFLTDVERIRVKCRERRIHCMFVFFPVSAWVDRRYHDYYRRLGYDIDGLEKGHPPVLRSLSNYFRCRGIAALDTLPTLRASTDVELFIPMDTHLNTRGHERVGKAVFGEWVRRGWLTGKEKAAVRPGMPKLYDCRV